MSGPNQVKLMDETLNIVLNADVSNEEFINEWLRVFKALCPLL
jgi:hypothetical protein